MLGTVLDIQVCGLRTHILMSVLILLGKRTGEKTSSQEQRLGHVIQDPALNSVLKDNRNYPGDGEEHVAPSGSQNMCSQDGSLFLGLAEPCFNRLYKKSLG